MDTGKTTTPSAWEKAFDSQLAKLDGSYKEMVFLTPPPYSYSGDLKTCYSPRTPPTSCLTKVSDSDYKTSMKMLTRVMTKHNGTVLDNVDWYCVKGRCPAFVDNNLMRHDMVHPSPEYVQTIVPAMREAFAPHMNATAAPDAAAPPATK